MQERLSEEELWSLVDRQAPELEAYLEEHPEDRERAAAFGAVFAGVRKQGIEQAEAEAWPVPEQVGPFRILEPLGEGGMGLVFEAQQQHPDRRVALKLLKPGLDRSLHGQEVEALAKLEHPHIARIYDAGTDEAGIAWCAMELIEGPSLLGHVEAHALTPEQRIGLIAEVCRAVGFAHRRGIVHRDLKPSNILVHPEDGPKVVDFGLAGKVSTAGEDILLGTLPYMSPEQCGSGAPIDARTDVFALGILLYRLLAGHLPLDPRDLPRDAFLQTRMHVETPSLEPFQRRFHGNLAPILAKALALEPHHRYADAHALADDLEALLQHRPLQARRRQPLHRLLQFRRRHRTRLLLGTSLLTLALLALWVTVFPVTLFQGFLPGWWTNRTPFDALRWQVDRPEVQLDGTWYGLVSVDGVAAESLIGRCKEFAGPTRWRKRFSEDFQQVLHRSGSFTLFEVDLVVRDLESGILRTLEDIPMREEGRRTALEDRNAMPFLLPRMHQDVVHVRHAGEDWQLVELQGHGPQDLALAMRRLQPRDGIALPASYDLAVEVLGHSPPRLLDLKLRSTKTAEILHLQDLDRYEHAEDFRSDLLPDLGDLREPRDS